MRVARHKFRISQVLQRFPMLAWVGHRVWRVFQARFTAGAVGVIFNESGHLLLLKHVYRSHYTWGLPGGYVSRNEDPAVTVARELLEETGLVVVAEVPLLVARSSMPGHLDLAYLCRLVSAADMRLSSEILDYGWFALDDVPEMLAFHRQAIRRACQVREDVAWV